VGVKGWEGGLKLLNTTKYHLCWKKGEFFFLPLGNFVLDFEREKNTCQITKKAELTSSYP